jgi:hypothetical protein
VVVEVAEVGASADGPIANILYRLDPAGLPLISGGQDGGRPC